LCYVGDYNRNVNSGLEGHWFRNQFGVGFYIGCIRFRSFKFNFLSQSLIFIFGWV